jgi:antitoxin ParD1/3/4
MEAQMAISAELGEKLEAVVNDLVANGRYNSKSEVLREGVRLVQEREAALAELMGEIQKGIDDIDAGRVFPAEEVFAELRAKYQAMIDDQK